MDLFSICEKCDDIYTITASDPYIVLFLLLLLVVSFVYLQFCCGRDLGSG